MKPPVAFVFFVCSVSVCSVAMSCQIAAAPADGRGQSAASVPGLLRSAASYVSHFVDQFANVVSEEQYTQDVLVGGSLLSERRDPHKSSTAPTHRVLRSDFLLLKTSDTLGWTSYRDVFEVDGAPVRDRTGRLTALFSDPRQDAAEQAARIAHESARYNIGPTERTLNTPVLALLFLQSALQSRFVFTLAPRTTEVSERVAILEYHEVARPTIIRTTQDTDRPASGRFWMESGSGRVLQSELRLTGRGVSATFTTTFQPDASLDIAVPVRLREDYQQPSGRLTGVATYGTFRQFSVNTRTTVDTERPAR